MEEVTAPKYRLVYWRYNETSANRVRMDVEWDSDQVCREQPRHESDRSGGCFLCHCARLITLST